MKVLIIGRGVIGSLCGWALERAGHTVELLVRPGRAVSYGNSIALDFYDARSKLAGIAVKEDWPITFREDLPTDHDFDLILVSVQHYRFAETADFLVGRVSKASILVFNNFWVDPQAATIQLPADRLVWGFPMAGGGFNEAGQLRGSLFRNVHFGTFSTDPTERELSVRSTFQDAGFKIVELRDFRGWLWTHFAINAGLHSQTLKAGSILRVFQVISEGRDAVLNIQELIPVLLARGVELNAHRSEIGPFRLPAALGALILRLAAFNRPVRAILSSHANPEELRSYCRDVLADAQRLGVPTPRLEAAARFFA
jgi:2-dehydropantoate 2-reductase